jgi:ubiquinone/menaquinone biosynthesis C-methylase UbiE
MLGHVASCFVDAVGCVKRSKSSGRDPIQITVCNIHREMLCVGERRAMDRYRPVVLHNLLALQFVQEGNAQDLSNFANNTFDLFAFGLQNATDVDRALREACRAMKRGGWFMSLQILGTGSAHCPMPV